MTEHPSSAAVYRAAGDDNSEDNGCNFYHASLLVMQILFFTDLQTPDVFVPYVVELVQTGTQLDNNLQALHVES